MRAPARIAYLGPEGTFSEEALLASIADGAVTPVPLATIRDAVMAVQGREVAGALVPIENSIEGSVAATLDTLAGEAVDVVIVGEVVRAVRQCLIAVREVPLERITTVVSHAQATGQCARFLRERLGHARVLAADSTAGAVRMVAREGDTAWAALGPRLAAAVYGCVVLAEGVEDHADNETRFVWLARADGASLPVAAEPERTAGGDRGEAPAHKTSLVFWGPGADAPGWLVACLQEFAAREINLTKIESRPRRERLGRYMFFVDAEGTVRDEAMVRALGALRRRCREVRVLGSYRAAM